MEPLSVEDGCELGVGEGVIVGLIEFCAPKTPGVGVLEGVGVRVAVGVGVLEEVGVGVRVGDGVAVGVFVGMGDGVSVGVVVGVGVGEGIVVGLGATRGTVWISSSDRNPEGERAVTSVGTVNVPVSCSTVAV
jgi:hypothetical protein